MRLRFFTISQFFFACTIVAGADGDSLTIGARPAAPIDVSRIATRLKDADVSRAVAAARELGDSRQPSASVPLLSFYADGDGERRLAAVKALGALSVWSVKKRPETFLAMALGDISATIRRQAARELLQAEGADAAMRRFIESAGDAKMHSLLERNRAVHHAAAVGGLRAFASLRETLSSKEIELALAAAEELGELRSLECVDALLKILGSSHDELKFAAADALERASGKAFKFDLIKWAEWRASLRDDFGREATSIESKEYANPADKWPAEIVIAFDTTGSFLHTWPDVNKALTAVLRELARAEPSLRVGLIRYRALDIRVTLRYTLQPTPLTWNGDAILKELSVASFGGGSGALHAALRYALNGMIWRERSRKIIVVIGDDSPVSMSEDPLKVAMQLTHDAAVLDGVQINTLYAKTTAGEENRQTYRLIAFSGMGRFYEYNKAEMHLVEMSADKVDVKANELPAETARKWLTPRDK